MDLVVTGASKSFGGLRAVSDVSFAVRAGTIFGLIGPNGAGKSTLFNLITGIVPLDAGTVRLGSAGLTGRGPAAVAAAGVARTFQNIRLFAELTVLENLLVAGEGRRSGGPLAAIFRTKGYAAGDRATRARALDLLGVFGLAAHAEARAGSLSYGDQRRVEIARAMMTEPRVILLDEPAAGMNTREAEALTERIRWLRATFGVAVALVEHNMQVVMDVCEEVLVLDHGEAIARGTPAQVRADPLVLAAYLGEDLDERGGASA
jgi:branched-chain amino acid transport system ATP-binding protein